DIATIASAAMLCRPGVTAVIVGARNRSITSPPTIDDLGGWDLFQALLATLRKVDGPSCDRHRHDCQCRHALPARRHGGDRRRAQSLDHLASN
ncbi:hypothetical protein, partial [Morganella morganii]|uniref:hypothetical protein n=1 Tax=Morganella morganii TaxID=582 RepID=UPI00197B86AE